MSLPAAFVRQALVASKLHFPSLSDTCSWCMWSALCARVGEELATDAHSNTSILCWCSTCHRFALHWGQVSFKNLTLCRPMVLQRLQHHQCLTLVLRKSTIYIAFRWRNKSNENTCCSIVTEFLQHTKVLLLQVHCSWKAEFAGVIQIRVNHVYMLSNFWTPLQNMM